MKGLILLLLAAGLSGQPSATNKASVDRLNSTLLALKRADASVKPHLTRQLVDEIVALSEKDRQPSRATVAGFANEFLDALIGKDLTSANLITLRTSIVQVTRGSGATFVPASSLREALTAVGIERSKVQDITRRFMAIGDEIRGPDDQRLF